MVGCVFTVCQPHEGTNLTHHRFICVLLDTCTCFESHLDAHSVVHCSLFIIHDMLDHYSMVLYRVRNILLPSLCFVSPAYTDFSIVRLPIRICVGPLNQMSYIFLGTLVHKKHATLKTNHSKLFSNQYVCILLNITRLSGFSRLLY